MHRFDDRKFNNMLDTAIFGRNLVHLPVTGSTNDHAAGLVGSMDISGTDNPEGTLIIADEQTGGRGRFNRDWISPPGGLWFSLICRTGLSLEKLPVVTLIAAFAAADTLICDYGIDASIKWPNDLYCGDSKFGGILSEGKKAKGLMYIIMGMGLNIDIDRKYLDRLGNSAVNIQELTRKNIIPESLLAHTLKKFEDIYLYYDDTGDFGSIFKNIEKILRY
jgi:BirA family transcriptional regulator, biotin operon repressor / biotin---[acetyl-CoA-carboxylase] ligase